MHEKNGLVPFFFAPTAEADSDSGREQTMNKMSCNVFPARLEMAGSVATLN
jgi:hypothetical protein